MTKMTHIAGAIATKSGVTLYLEGGGVMNLSSSGWKTKAILDEIMPDLVAHRVSKINLDKFSSEKILEQRTGGVLGFIRRKVVDFVTGRTEKTDDPAGDLVAVYKGKEIPGVEKIRAQMDYAVLNHTHAGLVRFMERIAEVIDERGHEVQELLTFMEKGDLPIAADGSIIAYKRLMIDADGDWVDCYSQKVKQKLGSHVSMPVENVDPSRRQECSTGLHIARRDYIGGFHGSVCVVVKIAPEDVVAVPEYQASKMRVAAYHIVAQLSDDLFSRLKNNQPMTSIPTGANLLGDIVSGNHIGITEYVSIGGPRGTEVTKRDAGYTPGATEKKTQKVNPIHAFDDEVSPGLVSPKNINKRAEEERKRQAAMSGDLSAAMTTKEPAAEPAKKASKPKLTKEEAQALKMVRDGKTRTEAERVTGVSRRKIGRLMNKGY